MLTRPLAATLALLLSVPALPAQDPAEGAGEAEVDAVTLRNGDRLTGTLKRIEDGTVVLSSPILGDVEIPLDAVADLVTHGPVTVVTEDGETLQRRITGRAEDTLRLAAAGPGRAAAELPLAELAAVNPELEPAAKWSGSVNVGLTLSDGNTERRTAVASAEAKRRTEQDRITGKVQWTYGEEKDSATGDWDLTERRLSGSLQYDYFLTECDYVLFRNQAVGDELAALNLRYTAGVGYGRQLFDAEEFELAVEGGVNYFFEDFEGATESNETVAGRLAYNVRWEILSWLGFLQDVQYLPSFEDFGDYYVTKESRLRAALTEAMFAQLEWQLEYDSTPATGLDELGNRYFVSAGWSF